MIKEIWINLPVKDIHKSKEFFTKIGFAFNSQYGNTADSACIVIGDQNLAIMLFTETIFKTFTTNNISDTNQGTEILFSFSSESREEIDQMAKNVEEAGGTIYSKPAENQGWMYGFGFADLDGHRWNMLFMDMSKMPQG
ncbi:MAG TPA: VOC family protein [Saprospiraceae bacterium]|nr:VOC family protein [Saprospiraceae bacterium]